MIGKRFCHWPTLRPGERTEALASPELCTEQRPGGRTPSSSPVVESPLLGRPLLPGVLRGRQPCRRRGGGNANRKQSLQEVPGTPNARPGRSGLCFVGFSGTKYNCLFCIKRSTANELLLKYLSGKLRLGNPSCFIFQMLRGSIMCYTNGWKVRTLGFNRGTTPNYLSKHGQEATFLKASDSFQNEEINLEGTFPCKSKLCNFQNLRKRITI